MKQFSLIIAVVIFSSFAMAQVLIPAAPSDVGLLSANSASINSLSGLSVIKDGSSGWYEGQMTNLIYLHELGTLVKALGCFPVASQVGAGVSYNYEGRFSGTLAPGQTFTVKVRVCEGSGRQAFPQVVIAYQNIRKSAQLKFTTITPKGDVIVGAHPTTTLPDKYIWGGVSDGLGMAGEWTLILRNPTKLNIQVYAANYSMYLLNSR